MKADTKELLDAQPPSDVGAEQAVIGSAFMLPDVMDDLSLILSPEDFSEPYNQATYRTLVEMHAAGTRIDTKLFHTATKKAGRPFDAVLHAELLQSVPTAANAAYYASLVREQAIRRDLKTAGTEIIRLAHAEDDAAESLNQSEAQILAIRDRRGTLSSQASDVSEILMGAMDEIDSRIAGKARGVETGFTGLDDLIGFVNSELIILAARTAMGKTALALNIAVEVATKCPVVLFSLEMDRLVIGDRLLASAARINSWRIRTGNLTGDERQAIVRSAAELSQTKLVIDDSPHMKIQDIAAVCRRQKRRAGLGMVIIDYLQFIQPDNPKDPREQQVSRISARLKGLARELDVPVICLAQLNRQSDSTKDNKPRLSHLRESGAIEQDADVVAFVHRPEYYATEPKEKERLKGQAEIHVEKNRNGRTGVVELWWYDGIVRFANKSSDPWQREFTD